MKYIQKQAEPPEFTRWKQQANANWQPTYEDLRGHEKTAVHEALMKEQGYICSYCEQRLDPNDSHIEHFQPQSDPAVDPLDFSNMLCSCQNRIKKGAPRHCGNLKGDWFDSNLLVSPLNQNCETAFKFTADGHIQPRKEKDQAAVTSINKLGLNIPKLREAREKAIEPFLEPSLSNAELEEFITGYLSPSPSGEFSEFWSCIKYVFGG